jgi:molybdenum cofactor biosynthesis enzyme MoaA
MSSVPNALVSNPKGEILELEDFGMAARSGDLYRKPFKEELISFPEEAEAAFIPDRSTILGNKRSRKLQVLKNKLTQPSFPAAAILPIGYLRTLLPSASPAPQGPFLPQWAYTAVGIQNGKWLCAAVKIDPSNRWENRFYNTPDLALHIQKKLSRHPQNRVLKQLALCATEYHCCTAENIFYQRWEGALPVSPACNADCVGCISLQPEGLPPSSHQRITFSPTVEEILETSIPHLENAEDSILSFGQGCEGEPLLASATIQKTIEAIRSKTNRGTLNLNTNGSRPNSFLKLCQAGLETVRISTNSARKETYECYYQPKGYQYEDVVETAKIAHDQGLGVSINLLTFPGVTDREEEAEALIHFIEKTKIHAIQWRNLAIDPDQYLAALPKRQGNALGIPTLLKLLKSRFTQLEFLSFSRPKEFFIRKDPHSLTNQS